MVFKKWPINGEDMTGCQRLGFLGMAFCLWSFGVCWCVSASELGAVPVPVINMAHWQGGVTIQSNQGKRAPARHVGAVMAILGTLNEAGVLPPEADPRANQLIRSLIQFQSVFMKSQEAVVQEYLWSALSQRWGIQGAAIENSFYKEGWTSESLEALVEYSKQHSMWENPRMETVFHSYNLSQADWALIEEKFLEARRHFESQNQDLHAVFARQRRRMPGDGG